MDVPPLARQWPAPERFGEEWAHDYGTFTPVEPAATDAAVAALVRLAAGGPVLEVAAGSGRVAIPLARAGLDVTATDASPKMLDRLRREDTGGRVRTRLEVLPAVGGDGYAVIAILLNSIWVLRTADDQQRFLTNAAARLAAGGVLVVEMAMVDPARWVEPREYRLASGAAIRRTTEIDPAAQVARHTFQMSAQIEPPRRREVYLRYLTPDQLLCMAAVAGLAPRHLWSSWDGGPHGPGSSHLVAVLQRAEDPGARARAANG